MPDVRRFPMAPLALVAVVGLGAAWLLLPVWNSGAAPDLSQQRAEAPMVTAALVTSIALLLAAIWRQDDYRPRLPGAAVALVAANTLVRETLAIGFGGVEPVYVLPILAGALGGAPMGFVVGSGSCLTSTIVSGHASEHLPTQALVWGLVGCLGFVGHRAGRLAVLACAPAGLIAGPLAGLLYNVPGWSTATTPQLDDTTFLPGLGWRGAGERLVQHTMETSLGLDVTRGVLTAVGILLVGPVLLPAMRRTWRPESSPENSPENSTAAVRAPHVAARDHLVRAAADRRIRARQRADNLWKGTTDD